MKALRNIINKKIKNSPLIKKINNELVIEFANNLLQNNFALDIGQEVRVIKITDKILTIACLNEDKLDNLKNSETIITNKINEHFKEKIIEKIKYLA